MRITAYSSTDLPGGPRPNSVVPEIVIRTVKRRQEGITLTETLIALMVIVIGMAGLFTTGAQSFRLLRRSKEVVAVRECLLTRLDSIRALSFAQVSKSSSMTGSTNLMVTGAIGDPNPFGATTSGMKNFTETITVYALGSQIFSSNAQRLNATPDYKGEYASQVDTAAPSPPNTYLSNSTTPGDWALQDPSTLPHYQITRVGIGTNAHVTVDTAADLTTAPALRVDVTYTWTDSSNIIRTQVGTMIVAKFGSLQ